MMQQALESTVSFVVHVEQECIYQGVDIATTYHALVSKSDINMWSLLDNVQINKKVNGGGSLIWADVVAIYRD